MKMTLDFEIDTWKELAGMCQDAYEFTLDEFWHNVSKTIEKNLYEAKRPALYDKD